MNFNKLIAFSFEDLKKIIQFSQEIGSKTSNDMSEKLIENINNLHNLKINDFVGESNKQVLYTKKSPIHYPWIIPND